MLGEILSKLEAAAKKSRKKNPIDRAVEIRRQYLRDCFFFEIMKTICEKTLISVEVSSLFERCNHLRDN